MKQNAPRAIKTISTWYLRASLALAGLFVLFICGLMFPAFTDSRNYEFIPLVSVIYLSALAFYIAEYQTLKILRYIDHNTAFSWRSIKALQSIKYCATSVSVLFIFGMYFFYRLAEAEDAPGVLALALIFAFAASAIAVFTTVLQKVLQSAIALKSEVDLTV